MSFKEYKALIMSDLYRYCGQKGLRNFVKVFLLIPGFKYTFFIRTTKYFKKGAFILVPLYVVFRICLHHYEYKYGISIPYNAEIGAGLYIGHFGGIVVSYEATLGKNCNISQGVCIGATYGGKYPGTPKIGNNVYLAPGCKVIGGITVGDNVAIGANCVVAEPVPDNATVIGIPGKVLSFKGSVSYIVNTDY